jgi:hypothetical protein
VIRFFHTPRLEKMPTFTTKSQYIDFLFMAVHSSLGLCHDNTDNKNMLACRSLVRWQLIHIA